MTSNTDIPRDPVRAWQDLAAAASSSSPSTAACVAAATRIAEQVWRHVAADPTLDTPTRAAVTGAATWARTALTAYQHLTGGGAYAHLDIPDPARCRADTARLRAWLTERSDLPGFTDTTVAETWNLDDDFAWDADGIGARMATLIEQAQRAGVYGVAGYTIDLRHLTTDDPDDDPIFEHQVTLHTPSGAVLASAPMASDHLADDGLSGVDAALAVLANTSVVVDELLDAERHLVADRMNAADGHLTTPRPPTRGFTALDLSTPTPMPDTSPTPPMPAVTRERHR
jgi:hypothetical protein